MDRLLSTVTIYIPYEPPMPHGEQSIYNLQRERTKTTMYVQYFTVLILYGDVRTARTCICTPCDLQLRCAVGRIAWRVDCGLLGETMRGRLHAA